MDQTKLAAVRRLKASYAKSMPEGVEVAGVGIGLAGSEPALKINLRRRPKDMDRLPKSIDGVPVVYDVVGKIQAR